MDTMWENCETDPKQWSAAMEAKFEGKGVSFGRDDWDRLLGDYQAVTDQPCAAFADELITAYPEAKVILNVRDSPQEWAESAKRLRAMQDRYAPSVPMRSIRRVLFPVREAVLDASHALQLVKKHADDYDDPETYYTGHNDLVRRSCAFAGRPLLEFQNKEGWGPLCEFLGKEIPCEPFPHTHTALSEEQQIVDYHKRQNVAALLKLGRSAGTLFALTAVVWAVVQRYRR
jgi:hypothetical protein